MNKTRPAILHLANDEKFIDSGFDLFEDILPGHNQCVVFSEEEEIKFIKTTPYSVRILKDIATKEFTEMIDMYDLIVLHSLDHAKLQVLEHISDNIVIVWIGFGYDYYDLIVKNRTDLFDPMTKALFLEHTYGKKGLPFYKDNNYMIVRMLKKLKLLVSRKKDKRKLVEKITYFAPVVNEEYMMVKEGSKGCFKPEFIDWNYGQVEYNLRKGYNNVSISSNNILIGNSANYENNHLEVFDLLQRLNIQDRKILAPLSYGNDVYRDAVMSEGIRLYGDNFLPFVDFMLIDEYVQYLLSCSVVIMNHIRQQAGGSIIIMLYLGATVFLKQVNPLYKMYKNLGATIFSIEELECNPELIHLCLNEKQININKRLIQEHFFRDAARQKTRKLLETTLKITISTDSCLSEE